MRSIMFLILLCVSAAVVHAMRHKTTAKAALSLEQHVAVPDGAPIPPQASLSR